MRRIASWLVLRPPARTKRDFIIFFIMVVIGVLIFLVMMLMAPSFPTTTTQISHGDRKMVIRLPPTTAPFQEEILVAGTGEVQERRIIRGPADAGNPAVSISSYNRRQLTVGEWAQMEAQREAWCADFPVFEPIPEGAPYYDVALRCGRVIDYDTEQFLVPLDALPDAFVMLIEALPSPQEAP
ncbi:MAG: hypothetical protein GFH27_549301n157 [Chloroflexi bacterium AL-W]|nr:hypothetical protein [Chloroflexi bacterium AL-N1]NOK68350.1 hypothetical protein [Chloroflexi bacterium AL-N10]NOK73996.1 hypothetical protein [Chloroflexi bacterium AL-N5]NOK82964.1 hypothetical protein [Chloroflexi bacterium AL-W]NOK90486.1 hypothetical protein [Chloroflexi bacterium AL-N15]